MLQDYIAVGDLSPEQFNNLIQLAARLKDEWQSGKARPLLEGKTLGMIFQKPSLRTRVSFDMAMLQLGGHALYLSPQEIGLGQRESIADVARVLSRYVDAIMARVFEHAHVVELARYSDKPVVNGLSDYEHPCQALADLFTVYEKKGELKGLKLAFLGDGNNVARSLMLACALSGMEFAIASPPGYQLNDESVTRASGIAEQTGGKVHLLEDPALAVQNADVLYTDVWASMGQEHEAIERRAKFHPYQVNEALMSRARPDAVFMHCLPAKRNQETTDGVMESPQSVVFDQAENRLHAQKALLLMLLG